jgi:Ser/Thr protein kinase RdoA (MazF antagonist)
MKSFSDLTELGQARRMRRVAERALESYDFDVARLRYVATETNTVFRVDTQDGRAFALRVGALRQDTDVDVATELAWVSALNRDTDLPVVHAHPNRTGDFITLAGHDGVPQERRCVLFGWLRGAVLEDRATPDSYAELGRIAAGLHVHGRQWEAPPGLQPLVWDRIFYYPTEPIVMFDSSHRNVMTPSRARVFRTVMARAEAELTRLQETGPRVWMHGDLNPWNVMVNRGSVTVFDFEDVTVGRPVQDIATTLFYGRDRPDYWELRNGFRRGYEAVLPWPVEYDGQLELLMAARSIMFVNYVIRTGDESDGEYSPAAYTDRVVKRLRTYLRDFPIRSC